jgi:PleD family two-component response regulator
MTPIPDRRFASERRRQARGGRRPDDQDGFAPLVLVADDDVGSGARCEAILAALRFAVAPAHSAEEALRVMHALRPNLVVSHLRDDATFRERLGADYETAGVPIISVTREIEEPEALVEEIRRVLRVTRESGSH